MKYKLIIFDIDGTITKHVSSWQFIHERLNIWDTTARRYQDMFLAGRISYKRFCELDAACWKGLSEKHIISIFGTVAYTKNAKACIRKLKSKGFKLAAVSTGLQYIADRIDKDLSLDYALTNRLLSRNGRLTGKVKINVAHGAKDKTVKEILKIFKVSPHETISIGDSEGDLPLARNTGYSIAFNSTSRALSRAVNYNCKSSDFKEAFQKIMDITFPI